METIQSIIYSPLTWGFFYALIMFPLMVWAITRDFIIVLDKFNIQINTDKKNACRRFFYTILTAIYISSFFFFLFTNLLVR